jgi:hypothetical protein
MGDSVHCIDGFRPFHGLRHILFVILGLRSQSLAPPQALCLRLLRRLIKIYARAAG